MKEEGKTSSSLPKIVILRRYISFLIIVFRSVMLIIVRLWPCTAVVVIFVVFSYLYSLGQV